MMVGTGRLYLYLRSGPPRPFSTPPRLDHPCSRQTRHCEVTSSEANDTQLTQPSSSPEELQTRFQALPRRHIRPPRPSLHSEDYRCTPPHLLLRFSRDGEGRRGSQTRTSSDNYWGCKSVASSIRPSSIPSNLMVLIFLSPSSQLDSSHPGYLPHLIAH